MIKLKAIFIALFIILVTRITRFWFDIFLYLDLLLAVIGVFSLILGVLYYKNRRGVVDKNRKEIVDIVFLYFLLGILGISQAILISEQSLFWSLASEMRLFIPGCVILLTFCSERTLRLGLSIMAWFVLIAHYIFAGLDYFGLTELVPEHLYGIDPYRGNRFKLNLSILLLMSLYFLLNGMSRLRFLFVLGTLILFIFIMVARIHSAALVLFVSAILLHNFIGFLKGYTIKRRSFFMVLLASPVLVYIFYFLADLLIFAGTNLFAGLDVIDVSSNSRKIQFLVVLPDYIEVFPFGFGKLSANSGLSLFEKYQYFFAEDLGIIGVLIVYGLLGALLYSFIFYRVYIIILQTFETYIARAIGIAVFVVWFVTGDPLLFAGVFLSFIVLIQKQQSALKDRIPLNQRNVY